MGGDLNLKKSWHPSLMTNQKRVWEEEQRALDERKKIEQIRKERDQERQIQELQELQEAAGGTKRLQRVDWMYSGPATGQPNTNEENEAYLLGKRRVDTLIQGKEKENLQKSGGQQSFMALQSANTPRDVTAKIREDPLLAIKKQEQAAYEAMMNDPVKRRMLLKAAGQEEQDEREHKRRKHHHRHDRHGHRSSRHRDDRDDRDRRSRSHKYDEDRRSQYTSGRPRSISRAGSPSSERRSRRSESPRRRRRNSSRDRSRERSRSRSRSPDRRHLSGAAIRPAKQDRQDVRGDTAARLAAMQTDASELDTQRHQRLREVAQREQATVDKDEETRARNARRDGRADFVAGFHKRAGDFSLSDRVDTMRHKDQDND